LLHGARLKESSEGRKFHAQLKPQHRPKYVKEQDHLEHAPNGRLTHRHTRIVFFCFTAKYADFPKRSST
jgi:hypothetical protein